MTEFTIVLKITIHKSIYKIKDFTDIIETYNEINSDGMEITVKEIKDNG